MVFTKSSVSYLGNLSLFSGKKSSPEGYSEVKPISGAHAQCLVLSDELGV